MSKPMQINHLDPRGKGGLGSWNRDLFDKSESLLDFQIPAANTGMRDYYATDTHTGSH